MSDGLSTLSTESLTAAVTSLLRKPLPDINVHTSNAEVGLQQGSGVAVRHGVAQQQNFGSQANVHSLQSEPSVAPSKSSSSSTISYLLNKPVDSHQNTAASDQRVESNSSNKKLKFSVENLHLAVSSSNTVTSQSSSVYGKNPTILDNTGNSSLTQQNIAALLSLNNQPSNNSSVLDNARNSPNALLQAIQGLPTQPLQQLIQSLLPQSDLMSPSHLPNTALPAVPISLDSGLIVASNAAEQNLITSHQPLPVQRPAHPSLSDAEGVQILSAAKLPIEQQALPTFQHAPPIVPQVPPMLQPAPPIGEDLLQSLVKGSARQQFPFLVQQSPEGGPIQLIPIGASLDLPLLQMLQKQGNKDAVALPDKDSLPASSGLVTIQPKPPVPSLQTLLTSSTPGTVGTRASPTVLDLNLLQSLLNSHLASKSPIPTPDSRVPMSQLPAFPVSDHVPLAIPTSTPAPEPTCTFTSINLQTSSDVPIPGSLETYSATQLQSALPAQSLPQPRPLQPKQPQIHLQLPPPSPLALSEIAAATPTAVQVPSYSAEVLTAQPAHSAEVLIAQPAHSAEIHVPPAQPPGSVDVITAQPPHSVDVLVAQPSHSVEVLTAQHSNSVEVLTSQPSHSVEVLSTQPSHLVEAHIPSAQHFHPIAPATEPIEDEQVDSSHETGEDAAVSSYHDNTESTATGAPSQEDHQSIQIFCTTCNKLYPDGCEVHGSDYVYIQDEPVLSRARASLPKCFYLQQTSTSDIKDFMGVWCKEYISERTLFGPVIGELTKIPTLDYKQQTDGFNPLRLSVMEEMCEVLCLSSEATCNWLMFVREAHALMEQNCVLYRDGPAFYLVTTTEVKEEEELLMWFSASLCEQLGISQDPENTKLYQCDQCGKNFTSKKFQTSHLKAIHPDHYRLNWTCPMCGKTFSSNSKLNSHMMLHMGLKPYTCTYCSKQFSDPSNLKTHILIHTGQKKYKCETCDKTFRQKAHLEAHRIVHTGSKKFNCTFCDKAFARQADLKTHTYRHTQEMSYTCATCGKKFYKMQNYKKHLKVHTGERNYMCNKCFKGFQTKYHRDRHLKICKEKNGKESSYMSLEEVAELGNTYEIPLKNVTLKRDGNAGDQSATENAEET